MKVYWLQGRLQIMPETDSEREALDTLIKSVLPALNLDLVSVVEEDLFSPDVGG